MTFKTISVRIFAYVHPYTPCKLTERSRVPKFTKLLSDVKESSSMLRQQLACDKRATRSQRLLEQRLLNVYKMERVHRGVILLLHVLRYSYPFSNVSSNNKGGECKLVAVSRHKIGCYSNVA